MNYRQYLHASTNVYDLQRRIGILTAQFKGGMCYRYATAVELRKAVSEMDINTVIRCIDTLLNKEKPAVTDMQQRLFNARRKLRERKGAEENFDFYMEDGIEALGGSHSDEMITINHGGEIGRILAFLHKGHGYRTCNPMPNFNKRIFSYEGIMVHSRYTGRAVEYAQSAGDGKCSLPAILTGKIARKYLFHNQGDEYSIPVWFAHHLQDVHILTADTREFYDFGYSHDGRVQHA